MPVNAFKALAHGGGTVSNTALALTDAPFSLSAANVGAASRARISCDTQPCRYTYDGTTPSASVGHILPINTTIFIEGNLNIKNFKIIRQGSSDGNVAVTLETI